MELPTVLLVVMFGLPVLAIIAIYLLARNWITPVEHPEDDGDRPDNDKKDKK